VPYSLYICGCDAERSVRAEHRYVTWWLYGRGRGVFKLLRDAQQAHLLKGAMERISLVVDRRKQELGRPTVPRNSDEASESNKCASQDDERRDGHRMSMRCKIGSRDRRSENHHRAKYMDGRAQPYQYHRKRLA
jgi:hypothetical protein